MAQTESARPQYPPLEDPGQGAYYGQQQHSPQRPPARDERSHYPSHPEQRQGQYPPPDSRAPAPYPPPGQWPGQQHSAYPPPPHHYPDPQHAAYPYPQPPRQDMSQPPQPMQPDAYRLPPPYPPYAYGHYPPPAPPAPAPRQRTAIACKYCRKRKIRCSGYDSSPEGRCQNCIRFNQQCLFHPVSSQAAFVPVAAVFGPGGGRAPISGQDRPGENGQYARNGEQPPMLYGAHGQPLGPPGPSGQPQYQYPPPHPQGYPPVYQYPPGGQYPPPGHPYEHPGQAPPPQEERVSHKRPPPDDDPHNENSHTAQSPHPNSKPRHSTYDSRANSGSSYGYTDPSPTSPATSIMSHQSYPAQPYTNGTGAPKGNVSPAAGLTPNSAHSFNSPHHGPVRDEGKTPPPQPGSAGSSVNGRSGMKVHEMLDRTNHHSGHPEQRAKNDNDMLSKLDGKK